MTTLFNSGRYLIETINHNGDLRITNRKTNEIKTLNSEQSEDLNEMATLYGRYNNTICGTLFREHV